jgi:hypothetical protein
MGKTTESDGIGRQGYPKREAFMASVGLTVIEDTRVRLLLRVTHHWAVHSGQIVFVAKAAHAGALDELWMETMKGR